MNRELRRTITLLAVAASAGFGQAPDFIQPASYATGGSSSFVAVGDFNGDRLPDIATYESTGQNLLILSGKPDGTFALPVSRNLGFAITSMASGDFNGDGKADLALSTGASVAILLNAGDGTFGAPAFFSAGVVANYVTAADVNHDGILDLVVAGGNGFTVLLGTGTGAFTTSAILSTAFSHFWVGVADFNNDGNMDLIADGSPGAFYAGRGDGTFAAPVVSSTIPGNAVIGDFDGDGKMDVAYLVVGFVHEQPATQTVSLLYGTGDGQFLNGFNDVFSGPGTGSVAAGDFNGDGLTDLAVWLTLPSRLYLMANGATNMSAIPVDLSAVASANLTAANLDANGSPDLLLWNTTNLNVIRNTHGNPPLLAVASVAPASVVGGARAQGTLTLGGPAPVGGASVTLASSNTAAAFPLAASVKIPAGSSSAKFGISTLAVAASTPVTIGGTWNGVTQNAIVTVVPPYTLTGFTINPNSQFGGFTVQGTVMLSGPADSKAKVLLSSSNTAVAIPPASVTVPAGASSAAFSIVLKPVAANTQVAISASIGGLLKQAAVTVLAPQDSVQITKAIYTTRIAQLRVEATSTSTTATLTAWNGSTGAFIGTLAAGTGGKYTGTFTVSPAVLTVTVKSSLGGVQTRPVQQK